MAVDPLVQEDEVGHEWLKAWRREPGMVAIKLDLRPYGGRMTLIEADERDCVWDPRDLLRAWRTACQDSQAGQITRQMGWTRLCAWFEGWRFSVKV